MDLLSVPWVELSLLVPLAGALWVARVRDQYVASRWCLAFAGATLACTLRAWAGHQFGLDPPGGSWDLARLTGRTVLGIDGLSAPSSRWWPCSTS